MRQLQMLLLLALVPLLPMEVCAQATLTITGKVRVEGGGLENAKVVVYRNGEKERVLTSGLGKFTMELALDATYTLSVEKDGFVTKKLQFDTKAPASAAAAGFKPFEFSVSLFKQYDDINIVVFNQPVGMIKYDAAVEDFNYDTDYTRSIQARMEAVMEQVAQKQKEDEERARAQALADAGARKAAEAAAREEARRKAAEDAAAQKAESGARKAAEQNAREEARKQAAADAEARKAAELAAREEARRKPMPAPEVAARPAPPVVRPSPAEAPRPAEPPVFRPTAAHRMPDDVVRNEELVVGSDQVITVIRLERAGVRTEFKRVYHKWGGVFYFKNGNSCSRELYESEALADR